MLLELLQVVEHDEVVVVACELAAHELFDRIGAVENFSEHEGKLVVAQIAAGLAHLHLAHNVAHRDLKTANILCLHDNTTAAGCVKLADFGFAVEFESFHGTTFADNCGTPN